MATSGTQCPSSCATAVVLRTSAAVAQPRRAVLTARINGLTEHMRTHDKDYASRRGLLAMVSRRRKLLDFLNRVKPKSYTDIIAKLGIRK